MSVRWERLAGDTGRFAFKVAFAPDPDRGRGANADVARSWGSFQVWVEGMNLCAHIEDGERVESVHWYLLPLMEWFARTWDPLLHEGRLPVENAADTAWGSLCATRFPPPAVETAEARVRDWEASWQSWWNRHALRAAREGGMFPDVVMRRCRDLIELSWGPIPNEDRFCRFVATASPSSCRFSPLEVATPLYEVLVGAARYLLSLDPESERLRRVATDLAGLRSGRAGERRLMWLAGLGVDERSVRNGWQRIRRAFSETGTPAREAALEVAASPLAVTGSCHAALMFGSLAPSISRQDVATLAGIMAASHSPDPHESDDAWSRATTGRAQGEAPWTEGYRLAEDLHEDLTMRFVGEEGVDIAGLIEHFGITVHDANLTDPRTRGASIAGPEHRPTIVINLRHDPNRSVFGRRFSLAHELCHLLMDRGASRRLAIASGPWAPRDIERRANAFAAMLLMPTELVERAVAALPVALETAEGIRELGCRLNSSYRSLLRHLENLGFLGETDRQRIEDELTRPGW